MTILPMDVAMVSRYMAPVESSQMILLALILEILDVILPTADMSVGVLSSGWAGSGIFHIGHGVDETSGQYRRSPYHQCSGGWKCWYGGSSQ